MGKLFVYEILSVGVGIIIASFIGMYVAAVSSNYVLINSVEQVFNFTLNNLEIVTFNIKYAIIDLIIAVIIIVISAMFPLLMIRKIKPVNILKAKE
jgi:ABC-type antimicrobial peptide transport system permease subunit